MTTPDIAVQPPCARGCTYPADDPNTAPDPRPATHGLLCSRCYFRITKALEAIPDLIINMRSQIAKSGAAQYGERVQTSENGTPIPLALDALDQSDALYTKLILWAARFAAHARIPLPRFSIWAGSDVHGMRPAEPETAGAIARRLTDWYLALAEVFATDPEIVEFHDALTTGGDDARGVYPLLARYGAMPPRPKPKQPHECPVCGNGDVFVKWPDKLNPDLEVMCDRCRVVIDPDIVNRHARHIAGALPDAPDWVDDLKPITRRCSGSVNCTSETHWPGCHSQKAENRRRRAG